MIDNILYYIYSIYRGGSFWPEVLILSGSSKSRLALAGFAVTPNCRQLHQGWFMD